MSFFRRPTDGSSSSDDETDDDECMSDCSSEVESTNHISTNVEDRGIHGSSVDSEEDSESESDPDSLSHSNITNTTSITEDLFQPLSINAIANDIRKSDRLSISNRLHSIKSDAQFVQDVADRLHLPLVANERCGSWYVPPAQKAGSCYFKSTDGHFGHWSFSLRRLNLGILPLIGDNGGCIIVDSTRRGKSIPDALSKTVPIWCAVMNAVLFPELQGEGFGIKLPENAVSGSEAAQIKPLLDGFVEQLKELKLDAKKLAGLLKRPMVPAWITRDDEDDWEEEATTGTPGELFNKVYLVSASKYLQKELQPRNSYAGGDGHNFVYIQGAGDDHESWARGLVPTMYWKHQDQLLQTPEAELPALIDGIVKDGIINTEGHSSLEGLSILSKVHGRIAICDISTYQTLVRARMPVAGAIVCTEVDNLPEATSTRPSDIPAFHTTIPSNKLGSKLLRSKLDEIAEFAGKILLQPSTTNGDAQHALVIACKTGNDVSVGIALALICHLFDSAGQFKHQDADEASASMSKSISIDKTMIRQRLTWILSERTQANPSRATLQAVNAFLMS